jgi:hypothetical protein
MTPWNPFRRAVLIAQRWARLLLGLEQEATTGAMKAEAVKEEAKRESALDAHGYSLAFIPMPDERWQWSAYNLGRLIAEGEAGTFEEADRCAAVAVARHVAARHACRSHMLTCPWCDDRVRDLGPDCVNRCPKCGHRADLPPASCDCDRCDGFRAQAARCRG